MADLDFFDGAIEGNKGAETSAALRNKINERMEERFKDLSPEEREKISANIDMQNDVIDYKLASVVASEALSGASIETDIAGRFSSMMRYINNNVGHAGDLLLDLDSNNPKPGYQDMTEGYAKSLVRDRLFKLGFTKTYNESTQVREDINMDDDAGLMKSILIFQTYFDDKQANNNDGIVGPKTLTLLQDDANMFSHVLASHTRDEFDEDELFDEDDYKDFKQGLEFEEDRLPDDSSETDMQGGLLDDPLFQDMDTEQKNRFKDIADDVGDNAAGKEDKPAVKEEPAGKEDKPAVKEEPKQDAVIHQVNDLGEIQANSSEDAPENVKEFDKITLPEATKVIEAERIQNLFDAAKKLYDRALTDEGMNQDDILDIVGDLVATTTAEEFKKLSDADKMNFYTSFEEKIAKMKNKGRENKDENNYESAQLWERNQQDVYTHTMDAGEIYAELDGKLNGYEVVFDAIKANNTDVQKRVTQQDALFVAKANEYAVLSAEVGATKVGIDEHSIKGDTFDMIIRWNQKYINQDSLYALQTDLLDSQIKSILLNGSRDFSSIEENQKELLKKTEKTKTRYLEVKELFAERKSQGIDLKDYEEVFLEDLDANISSVDNALSTLHTYVDPNGGTGKIAIAKQLGTDLVTWAVAHKDLYIQQEEVSNLQKRLANDIFNEELQTDLDLATITLEEKELALQNAGEVISGTSELKVGKLKIAEDLVAVFEKPRTSKKDKLSYYTDLAVSQKIESDIISVANVSDTGQAIIPLWEEKLGEKRDEQKTIIFTQKIANTEQFNKQLGVTNSFIDASGKEKGRAEGEIMTHKSALKVLIDDEENRDTMKIFETQDLLSNEQDNKDSAEKNLATGYLRNQLLLQQKDYGELVDVQSTIDGFIEEKSFKQKQFISFGEKITTIEAVITQMRNTITDLEGVGSDIVINKITELFTQLDAQEKLLTAIQDKRTVLTSEISILSDKIKELESVEGYYTSRITFIEAHAQYTITTERIKQISEKIGTWTEAITTYNGSISQHDRTIAMHTFNINENQKITNGTLEDSQKINQLKKEIRALEAEQEEFRNLIKKAESHIRTLEAKKAPYDARLTSDLAQQNATLAAFDTAIIDMRSHTDDFGFKTIDLDEPVFDTTQIQYSEEEVVQKM